MQKRPHNIIIKCMVFLRLKRLLVIRAVKRAERASDKNGIFRRRKNVLF